MRQADQPQEHFHSRLLQNQRKNVKRRENDKRKNLKKKVMFCFLLCKRHDNIRLEVTLMGKQRVYGQAAGGPQ